MSGKSQEELCISSMTLAVFTLVTRSYGFAIFDCSWIVFIWFIKVAIHEVGHVLAGWFAGMRFESVAIGSVWLTREEGKMKICFKRHVLGDRANMSIMRLRRVRRQLVILTLGGPIATLLATLAVATLCYSVRFALGKLRVRNVRCLHLHFYDFLPLLLCLGLILRLTAPFQTMGLILNVLAYVPGSVNEMDFGACAPPSHKPRR